MSVASFELAPGVEIGGTALPFIAGPCVIETAEVTLEMARWVAATSAELAMPSIFKASYDKANRSSIDSYRGPGLATGLRVLQQIAAQTSLPILTDVHEPEHCEPAAEVCAVLQIPAFLCRQTDLVLAAARTGRAVNLKKGQFMAPDDMRRAVDKARSTGNERISVTERGFSFGYHNLIVDMRSFAMMHQEGIAVIYDVTHSLQLPGGGIETGGLRQYAEPLTQAAVAAGADALYLEVHPRPGEALSDRTTQLEPARAAALLARAQAIHTALASAEAISR
jgi:2-dehydro-3-deoxyphosphooctonate aldolase (KDO 8-P synthase)